MATGMDPHTVSDKQPKSGRKGGHYFFQQLDLVGSVSFGRDDDGGLAGCWLNGTLHPDRTPPAITKVVGAADESLMPFLIGETLGGKWPSSTMQLGPHVIWPGYIRPEHGSFLSRPLGRVSPHLETHSIRFASQRAKRPAPWHLSASLAALRMGRLYYTRGCYETR
jgi:hypothetical protein